MKSRPLVLRLTLSAVVALLNSANLRASEVIHNQSSGKSPVASTTHHAFSQDGDPKYPMGFKHFSYANPDAPKGGVLKRASVTTTYSTFNPDLARCETVAPGSRNLYGGLMKWALDDYNTQYPNIAKSLQVAVDKSYVIYDLNDAATFNDPSNDGCDPNKPPKREKVTAEDVKFSFEAVKASSGSGAMSFFKDIESVEVIDDHRVKFNIKPENWRSAIPATGSFNIYSKKFHSSKSNPFDRCSREPIPGTGAYIVQGNTDLKLKYKRVCNHWAEKVPSNVGHNNFDQIHYELYKDSTSVEGSFRTGETDLLTSINLNRWPENVNDVSQGTNMFQDSNSMSAIKNKEMTLHQLSTPYDGFVREMAINSANPALKDRRVRKALSLLYETEFTSGILDKGTEVPAGTYFPAAKPELASEEKVRALLEKQKSAHGDRFPDEALTGSKQIATDGKSYATLFRERAREANRLMKEAGWNLQRDPDGSNKQVWMKGQWKFPSLSVPTTTPGQFLLYKSRLAQFGIDVDLRQVGDAQISVLKDQNKYDLYSRWIRHDPVPGPELAGVWGSEAARATRGSDNLTRTSSPVVDSLMDTVVNARNREDRQVAIEALNRVIKAEHSSILLPRAKSSIYIAKRSQIGGVENLPTSGRIGTASIAEETWWDKSLKPGK